MMTLTLHWWMVLAVLLFTGSIFSIVKGSKHKGTPECLLTTLFGIVLLSLGTLTTLLGFTYT